MIEAIVFDWFGVCTERWLPLWRRELRSKADGNLLEKSFMRYLDDWADNSISGQEFLNSVFREINVEPRGYHYLLRKLPRLNHELLDIILKLREAGYRTAILSDNFKEVVPLIEEKIGGFEKYFDIICLSNRLGTGKNNTQIYTKTRDLLLEFGIQDKKCVFVDDRQKNLDIAKQIGWKTILYENNMQLKNRLAEHGIILD
jgi:HAD superfamily hydrolase (TIGR01509 family)